MIRLTLPLKDENIKELKAGDTVYLSGTLYTGRDAAHKRLVEMIESGQSLPVNLLNETIYYVGPTPTMPGKVIGVCGPTTSYRMDGLTEPLMKKGLKGMIGKGKRSDEVKKLIVDHGGVYFGAIGGAAAKISKCIEACEIVAFEDLGPEAIRRLTVRDLPVMVVVDSMGNDYYQEGMARYLNGE